MDDRRQELLDFKEMVFSNLTTWNTKYLHYNSVSNFIEHFDKIKTEHDKIWIFDALHTYLTFCNGADEEITRQESSDIFSDYLNKVSNYYRYSMGFRMVANKVVYFLDYAVVFVSVWLLFNIYSALAVIPLFIYHQYRAKDRIERKECYGLFY